jgi:hypothetical protein
VEGKRKEKKGKEEEVYISNSEGKVSYDSNQPTLQQEVGLQYVNRWR